MLNERKMLGFVHRKASRIHSVEVQDVLYHSLVRSKLGHASVELAPQTATGILKKKEQVQLRATKFFLSLPYRTDIPYSTRYYSSIYYKHEFFDLVCLFIAGVLSNGTD